MIVNICVLVFLGIVIIYAYIYQSLLEIGWKPKEVEILKTKETKFEAFRRVSVSHGFPFDGITMCNSYYQSNKYGAPPKGIINFFFKEREVSQQIWLDTRSGYIVLETENSINIVNQVNTQ